MSWSDDAQNSKSGTSSRAAGDPVVPCVEQALVEPVIDFNEPTDVAPVLTVPEQTAVQPRVTVEPGVGPLQTSVAVIPPPPAKDGEDAG